MAWKRGEIHKVILMGLDGEPYTAGALTGTVTANELIRELVYIKSDGTFAQADATDNSKPAIGVIVAKPTSTTAVIKLFGKVGGYTGLTRGALQYLSETLGALTESAPAGSNKIVQPVGYAISTTQVLFNIVPQWTVNP